MTLASRVGLLEWVPKITYLDCDVPTSFTLLLPQGRWRYRSTGHGGRDVAESGVTESFVVRHDRGYELRLRFTEEEWVESVEPWLKIVHAQEQSFTLQLDANDAATIHTVYLVSPVTGDVVSPEPNPYSGVLELAVAVRTSDGTALSYPYFPSLA
jgi:hypothetical protein